MLKNKSLFRRFLCLALCLAPALCISSAFAAAYQPQGRSDSIYVIENEKFGIYNDNTHPGETLNGLNDAIDWAAENGYNGVRLTDGDYRIVYVAQTYGGLTPPSNFTLDLGNAVMYMNPHNYYRSTFVYVNNAENVTIKGGKLIGDRYEHVYEQIWDNRNTHEWGMGVLVENSRNITISNMDISNMAGDAIWTNSDNLTVKNCKLHNCRRQGISFIGGRGGEIAYNDIYEIGMGETVSGVITSAGADPKSGIDLEIETGDDFGGYGLKIHDNHFYDKEKSDKEGIHVCWMSFGVEVYNNKFDNIGTNIYGTSNYSFHDNTMNNSWIGVKSSASDIYFKNNTLNNTTFNDESENNRYHVLLLAGDGGSFKTDNTNQYMELGEKVTGVKWKAAGTAFPALPEIIPDEGHEFTGWYDENGNRVETFPTVINENVVYTARFAEKAEAPTPSPSGSPSPSASPSPSTEPDPTWPENPFSDVKSPDWFYPYVKYVQQNKLMVGTSDTTFEPDAATDRGMTVTILYRLEGEPSVSGLSNFPDIPSGEWYANAVAWAKEKGITYGDEFGNFGAEDYLTREQLAAFLYRYAQLKGKAAESKIWLDFADIGEISDWAEEPIKWCVENGIISGKENNTLDPQGEATRAEMATMISRFLEKVS